MKTPLWLTVPMEELDEVEDDDMITVTVLTEGKGSKR